MARRLSLAPQATNLTYAGTSTENTALNAILDDEKTKIAVPAGSQGPQNKVVHAQPTFAPSSQQPKNEVVRTKTSSSPPMDNEATHNLQKTIKAFVFQTYPTTPKDWLHQPLTLQKQVVQQLQSPATNGAVDNPQHPNTL
mgnify:CR=1 FL=1